MSIQQEQPRLRIRLRECMDLYEARTGLRVTYPELAARAGLSIAAIQSIGSRGHYNATLDVIERLCVALDVSPTELLEWHDASGSPPPVQE